MVNVCVCVHMCRGPGVSVHWGAEESSDAHSLWICPRPRLSTNIYDPWQTKAGVFWGCVNFLSILHLTASVFWYKVVCVCMCVCVAVCVHVLLCQILEGLQQMCTVSQKEGTFTEARRDAVKAIAQWVSIYFLILLLCSLPCLSASLTAWLCRQ